MISRTISRKEFTAKYTAMSICAKCSSETSSKSVGLPYSAALVSVSVLSDSPSCWSTIAFSRDYFLAMNRLSAIRGPLRIRRAVRSRTVQETFQTLFSRQATRATMKYFKVRRLLFQARTANSSESISVFRLPVSITFPALWFVLKLLLPVFEVGLF